VNEVVQGAVDPERRVSSKSGRVGRQGGVALPRGHGDPRFFSNRDLVFKDFPELWKRGRQTPKGRTIDLRTHEQRRKLARKRGIRDKKDGFSGGRGARDFGQWNDLIRELACYDPDQYDRILHWQIREGLLAYTNKIREEAKVEYRLQKIAYYTGNLKKMPKPPKILE
jgi:hypothetical protein